MMVIHSPMFSQFDASDTSNASLFPIYKSQFNDAIANLPEPEDDGQLYDFHRTPYSGYPHETPTKNSDKIISPLAPFGSEDLVFQPSDEPISFDTATYPTTLYEYEFDGIAPEKIKVSQRENNATNDPYDSYQFYDGLGNLIQTKTEAANSSEQIVTDTFYDSSLRVQRKSNPYFASFNANFTTPNSTIPFSNLSYDPLSRIIRATNPDNTTKSFNYSKWNISITDENGNKLLQVQDAFSQIIQIHEFNGASSYVTKYNYSAAGELTNITDSLGNQFKFTYDTLGRKTSLIDPDLGVWTYTYDAGGNLIKQIDNRSTVITLQFDQLNRLTIKNSSTEMINFTYDQKTNGTLTQIKTIDYSFNFTYDNRYRKGSELKIISGNSSTTQYNYDDLDRVTSIYLPNGESIYQYYDNQSQLSQIQGILSLIRRNEFSKPTLRAYENNLNTTFTYDPLSSRLTRIFTNGKQDLNYQYDNTSNILQIQDAINSIIQTMGYDPLNRLTYAARTDNSKEHENYILNYSYNSIGNILTITEGNANTISTYTYQNSPIHAPRNISQSGPIIEVKNLELVEINGTTRTFRFHIKNNGAINLTNLNFSFFTGVTAINSTIPINLTSQESIFVFVSYNYSNSTTYKITARASNLTLIHQQSLAIRQTLAANASNLTQSFIYDANGNQIADSQYYYEYNSFNQLSKIRLGNSTGNITAEYLYDSDGNRIRKMDAIKRETTFYINPNFMRVANGTGTPMSFYDTIYYYDGSTLVARKDPNGKKFFYHPDHLGSTTLITNESGSIVEDTNYKPFGEVLYDGKSRFQYTGKEKDSESGLYYYGARYYNPVIGRHAQWIN